MRNPEFQTWLITSKGLTKKSARDCASRLKRADKLNSQAGADLEISPADEFIMHLGRNEEFRRLKKDVRSQIKRSVTLFKEFQATHHQL